MYILENTVLPVNEKLKAIRRHLRIKQQDLAANDINRSLISYIESGKVKLTKDTASVLAKNLKKILKERNLEYNVDADYLLADEKGQIGYILDTKVENIKKYIDTNDDEKFMKELGDAERLIEKWDIPSKKAKVFEVAGDYYYNKWLMDRSTIYYMKSLENYVRISDYLKISDINSKLARCSLMKDDNEEAIHLNNYSLYILESNNIINPDIEKRCLFNNALGYYKTGQYRESLEYLNILTERYSNLTTYQYLDVLSLKGIDYIYFEKFDEAMKIFRQMLKIAEKEKDKETLARTYRNIGTIYYRTNRIEESIKYEEKSLELRKDVNNELVIPTIKEIIKRYSELGNYNMSEKYLLRLLDIAKEKKDKKLLINTYNNLLEIYLASDDVVQDDSIIDEIFEFINNSSNIEELKNIILNLCIYYCDKDLEKVKFLLKINSKMGGE